MINPLSVVLLSHQWGAVHASAPPAERAAVSARFRCTVERMTERTLPTVMRKVIAHAVRA
jgi:hypothetical protein